MDKDEFLRKELQIAREKVIAACKKRLPNVLEFRGKAHRIWLKLETALKTTLDGS